MTDLCFVPSFFREVDFNFMGILDFQRPGKSYQLPGTIIRYIFFQKSYQLT